MGIRFFCPNGHYLNVKSEFAGKVARCNTCNVQMRVPMASMIEKGVKEYSGQPTAELVPEVNLPSPAPQGVAPSPVSSVAELIRNPDPLWQVIIQDSVAPYGPVDGAVLVEWIRERRVGPETFVRRVDWKSKIEAKEVLPREVFDRVNFGSDSYSESSWNNENLNAVGVASGSEKSTQIPEETRDFDSAFRRHKIASRYFYAICSLVGCLFILTVVLLAILLRSRG